MHSSNREPIPAAVPKSSASGHPHKQRGTSVSKPPVDYFLCMRAQTCATGAHVHTAANLLTAYLGEHALEDFVLDRFKMAENRLRAFVTRMIPTA